MIFVTRNYHANSLCDLFISLIISILRIIFYYAHFLCIPTSPECRHLNKVVGNSEKYTRFLDAIKNNNILLV